MNFSKKIKSTRKRLGVTQRELAEIVGVAPNTVARWERGEYAPTNPKPVVAMLDGLTKPSTQP